MQGYTVRIEGSAHTGYFLLHVGHAECGMELVPLYGMANGGPPGSILHRTPARQFWLIIPQIFPQKLDSLFYLVLCLPNKSAEISQTWNSTNLLGFLLMDLFVGL